MNGELENVWSRTWGELWVSLRKAAFAPPDLFADLVGELATPPVQPESPPSPPPEAFSAEGVLVDREALLAQSEYEQAVQEFDRERQQYSDACNGLGSRTYFRKTVVSTQSEFEMIAFLEAAYETIDAFGIANLTSRYKQLVRDFLEKYSLRYELVGAFSLRATISGLFAGLMKEIKTASTGNDHVMEMFSEFEHAFSDLRTDRSQPRLKTCIQKQFNLLEALGANNPNVTHNTLGAMCDQLDWPHATIKGVGKKLYGFRSDYPGMGHGGNAQSALRPIEMKDFVSISLMLAAFTPYLVDQLDAERCYSA